MSDRTRQDELRFGIEAGLYLSDGTDVPKLVQLPALRQAAHDVENHSDDLSALKILIDAGTGGLGGARPKASVQDGSSLGDPQSGRHAVRSTTRLTDKQSLL